ncbi:iron ABC transporter substrate-binding protein [Pseudomonas sp. DC3000-4b1]|uniref:iron ABC transporter substrate-binding protein n=1 Tax=unclassified Pseudomonas TaxID=196821 RepID=UPI003CEC8AE7
MSTRIAFLRLCALPTLALALCLGTAQAADAPTLTLYNGQHKELGEAIAKAFEASTGIHVNVRKGSSNQLASQIMEEGDRSPADVIYSEESPPLNALGEKGFLAVTDKATLDALPPEYVAQDGTWIGITARVRVVAYNPSLVDEKDLPPTVMDFAQPQWNGKIGFVPTSGAFQEQAVAVLRLKGEEAAEEWLTGLKAYGKTYANNMVAIKAVENGEIAAVLVNNYYWYALKKEKGDLKSRLYYFKNKDPGALVSISSAAVVKASKHPQQAQQLLAWMTSEEGQRVITRAQAEYPLRKGMVSDQGLKPFEELEAPDITPAQIGNAEEALDLERDVGLN